MQRVVIDLTTTTTTKRKAEAEASDQQAKRQRTMVESEIPPLTMLTVAAKAASDPFLLKHRDVWMKYTNHCTDALIVEAFALSGVDGLKMRLVILDAIYERKEKFRNIGSLWLQVYCILTVVALPVKLKNEGIKRLKTIAEAWHKKFPENLVIKNYVYLIENHEVDKKNVKRLIEILDIVLARAYEIHMDWYSMKNFNEVVKNRNPQTYITWSESYKFFEKCLISYFYAIHAKATSFKVVIEDRLLRNVRLFLLVKDTRKLQGYLLALCMKKNSEAKKEHEVMSKYLADVCKINKYLFHSERWRKLKKKYYVVTDNFGEASRVGLHL